MLESHALISPAQWSNTVVLEIAEIRNEDGSSPFVDNAAMVARSPMFAAAFHWGQQNPLRSDEVQQIFDSGPRPGSLTRWRGKLKEVLNDHDVKDGFSNAFTRQTGLEVM